MTISDTIEDVLNSLTKIKTTIKNKLTYTTDIQRFDSVVRRARDCMFYYPLIVSDNIDLKFAEYIHREHQLKMAELTKMYLDMNKFVASDLNNADIQQQIIDRMRDATGKKNSSDLVKHHEYEENVSVEIPRHILEAIRDYEKPIVELDLPTSIVETFKRTGSAKIRLTEAPQFQWLMTRLYVWSRYSETRTQIWPIKSSQ